MTTRCAVRIEAELRAGLANLKALEADYCRVRLGDDGGAAVIELQNLASAIAEQRVALRSALDGAKDELARIAALDAAMMQADDAPLPFEPAEPNPACWRPTRDGRGWTRQRSGATETLIDLGNRGVLAQVKCAGNDKVRVRRCFAWGDRKALVEWLTDRAAG